MKIKLLLATVGLTVFTAQVATAQQGRMGQRPSPEQLFKKIDANGDGIISLTEFKSMPRPQNRNGQAVNVEDAFQRIDTDGDGFLTLSELEQGRPGKGQRPPRRNAEAHGIGDGKPMGESLSGGRKVESEHRAPRVSFEKLDRNSDGKLSLEEFKSMPTPPQKGAGKVPSKTTAFQKMDIDGDGFLSKEELENGKPRIQRGGRPEIKKPSKPTLSGGKRPSMPKVKNVEMPKVDFKTAKKAFKGLDADRSKSLSLTEFTSSGVFGKGLAAKKLYNRLDLDKNGKVTKRELKVLKSLAKGLK